VRFELPAKGKAVPGAYHLVWNETPA